MSAIRSFGAITGLHPFNLNRISFTIALSVAALVIAKLLDAYLFCGFNENFFPDLPFGVALFVSVCFLPLLGLRLYRKATTKAGDCCRIFAFALITYWLFFTCWAIFLLHALAPIVSVDPFNVCGNRTIDNVREQFSNATATFDIFQRIDLIFKIAVGLGWLVPFLFAGTAMAFIEEPEDFPPARFHQAKKKDPELGKPAEENGETIIWMEESGEESIDIQDELAPDDAAREAEDRKSQVGSFDMRMKNLRNETNEPISNAEPQSKEAKEPEFSIVDEDEETTATKTANEHSKMKNEDEVTKNPEEEMYLAL